jgi:hypothetical protein
MADAKQKKQLYLLAVLLALSILVWYFQFAKRPVASGFSMESGAYTPINAQDFSGVLEQLSKAQSTEYKSTGRNIFIAGAVQVEPDHSGPVVPVKAPYRKVGPELPPPPPPAQLSMKFFGYGNLPSGGPRRAFLLDGEDVLIVGEGETVQNHIRILRIGNESIEFEDTNTHQRGSNPIEASPSSPAV